MLIIRLKPFGRKRRKHYRIVVAEKMRHVSKKSQVDLGWYNPYSKEINIDKESLQKYLDLKIEISQTLQSILKKNSLIN